MAKLSKQDTPHRKSTTFTKGSVMCACHSRERKTRDDGNGDSVATGRCTQCFDLAGIQVAMMAGEGLTEADRSTIAAHIATITARGGNDEWTDVFGAAPSARQAAAPVADELG